MKTKRAQGWGFDLVVASIIFTFAIVFFYIFAINYSTGGEETFNELIYEGQLVAESILSEGYPPDWNSTNVVTIGILNNNKINKTKLDRFYNLTNEDYNKTKSLFRIRHNYYINLSVNVEINGENIAYIGAYKEAPENLIKITRFSIYDNKPVSLDINVWA